MSHAPSARRTPHALRRPLTWIGRSLLALLAGAALYIAAALLGTVARPGPDLPPETDGPVTLFVTSNGFHTNIVVPKTTPEQDWTALLRAAPNTAPHAQAARWVSLGWGSQTAYTELLTLSDLTPSIALRALAFDRSVLHVLPLAGPPSGAGVHRVEISRAGYRRLVADVSQTLARDESGAPRPLAGLTHGRGDAFFRGAARFTPWRSCNVWTGNLLREAGLRIGLWTPFAASVTWALGAP